MTSCKSCLNCANVFTFFHSDSSSPYTIRCLDNNGAHSKTVQLGDNIRIEHGRADNKLSVAEHCPAYVPTTHPLTCPGRMDNVKANFEKYTDEQIKRLYHHPNRKKVLSKVDNFFMDVAAERIQQIEENEKVIESAILANKATEIKAWGIWS